MKSANDNPKTSPAQYGLRLAISALLYQHGKKRTIEILREQALKIEFPL